MGPVQSLYEDDLSGGCRNSLVSPPTKLLALEVKPTYRPSSLI